MKNRSGSNSVSAIILSAGRSERFGMPKCFLNFDSSDSFLERLIKVYAEADIQHIVIVLNEEVKAKAEELIKPLTKKLNISIVINEHPEEGRFSSIKLGIGAINSNDCAFIQNIDNPFTSKDILEKLKTKLEKGNYAVPVYTNKKGHPVLLSYEILQDIRKVSDPNTNLRDFIEKYPCNELKTTDGSIHANINTKIEYEKYFSYEAIHRNT